MSRFYLFELPSSLVEPLEPFKFDLSGAAGAATEEPAEALQSSSESEDADAADEHDSEDSSSSSSASSSEDSEAEEGAPKRPRPLPKKSTFSSAVTKYADDAGDDDAAMEQWQLENRAHIKGTPYVYFTSPGAVPAGQVLAIFKSWFDAQGLIDAPVAEVRKLPAAGKSCILMLSSGNFAGAIFDHRRHHHKTNISNPFANIVVLESKTFHRYTTRRKQGGAQSASDNAHGKANSAGSTIRRANERALQDEIRDLLRAWAPQLAACHRVFIRAPGRANRQLLSGYPDAPLGSKDPRIAPIPFATGRPTLNECKSAWLQLTQAQILDAPAAPVLPPPAAAASSPASRQSSKQASPAPGAAAKPAPSKEEQVSSQIADLIKRSKLPALRTLIDSDAAGNVDFPLVPHNRYFAYPTPLLLAAHFDKQNVVSQLLKWGANPLARNEQGQALGDIAPSKKTREALQVVRQALGESAWDWSAAKVGPPLTREQIVQRDLKERLRIQEEHERAAAEQEKKEKEARMERLIKKSGSGRLVGGLYEASRGLSEDELKRVERERRARAAEARLARLQ